MESTITKVDDNSIQIVKEIITTQTNTYSLGDLVKQRENIEAQKAREIEQRDKELLEVDGLIAECEKLGIVIEKAPVVEPIIK